MTVITAWKHLIGPQRAIYIAMDLTKMLQELRDERATVEEAILVLECIAAGGPKRRGRPPKWMTGTGERRGTYIRTPEARARMAAAQRARWAKRRAKA